MHVFSGVARSALSNGGIRTVQLVILGVLISPRVAALRGMKSSVRLRSLSANIMLAC